MTNHTDPAGLSSYPDRTVQVPVSLPTREQVAEALYTSEGHPEGEWATLHLLLQGVYLDYADAVLALLSQPTPTADRNAWNAAVQAKRREQYAKGYTTEHDREHGVEHLLSWAQDYASRGRQLDAAALVEAAREVLLWQRTAKSDYDVIDEQYRGVAPTAEPKMIDCPKCGLQYDHGDGTHASWPPTAKPPRIEDLAPGTTFVARHADHWKRFEYDGAGRIRFVGGNGSWFLLNGPRGIRIDPSTIRDVTPPSHG